MSGEHQQNKWVDGEGLGSSPRERGALVAGWHEYA